MGSLSRILLLAVGVSLTGSSYAAVDSDGFSNESELGVLWSTGNSNSRSYNAKQLDLYAWSENLVTFNARYLSTRAGALESSRYWLLALRYERHLSERTASFLGQTLESNIFAGFFQRYSSDIGLKYYLIREASSQWSGEAGYRYSVENLTTGKQTISNYLRFFTEAERTLTGTTTGKFSIEYLPNLTRSEDYLLNVETSLGVMMNKTLSLRTTYLVKFDHLPAENVKEKTDTVFTTALVAKF